MKKIMIVLLLSVSTLIGVFASGQKETAKEKDHLVIGCNNFLKGIYSLDILEKNFITTCNALGVEPMVVNDEGKIENTVTNVDNMIASGVDGIIILGLSDTLFPVIAKKCEAAGVAYAFYDHMPSQKSLSLFKDKPNFAGIAATSDLNTGRNIGEYAAKTGLRKAIIVTGETTDTTHSARTNGFIKAFEAAGGEVLAEGYGNVTIAEGLSRADDLMTAYPNIDCVYATNGDLGTASMEALDKHSEINAKLYCTDLDPDVLDGLENGKVAAANGAHWVNIDYTTALIVNFLQGNKLRDSDGNAPILTVPVMTLPNKYIELYNNQWIENSPYSDDEIRSLVGPNVTLDSIQAMLDRYTIEDRLTDMVKSGVITQAALNQANGI